MNSSKYFVMSSDILARIIRVKVLFSSSSNGNLDPSPSAASFVLIASITFASVAVNVRDRWTASRPTLGAHIGSRNMAAPN
jgi:hypothetical protein